MKKRILSLLPLAMVLAALLCAPAFALTEAEVEAQVAASSKEAVTGNVLVWFFCAVAFLKVSQKVDSILGTLGINVGRTGGSLMAEAMIAARGVTMIAKAGGHAVGSAGRSGGNPSNTASPGTTGGFFKGGLIGMAGRHITSSAVKTATSQTDAVHTAQNQSGLSSIHTASSAQSEGSHTASSVQTGGAHTANVIRGGGVNTDRSGVIHTDSSFQSGGVNTDTSGIIQTDKSVQSAAFQSDSSIISGQDSTSSETYSDSAVFADAMTQQEGVIFTGHESQSATHTESGALGAAPDAGGNVPGPAPGVGGDSSFVSMEGATQVSQSAHNAQTVVADSGGEHVHTQSSNVETAHTQSSTHTVRQTSIGGAVFARSLASGGKFANDVIGTVARGEAAGSITGAMAAQSLHSYLGFTVERKQPPIFSNTEIGGGRITGSVSTPEHPQPIAFGMYHAAQYTEPAGQFSKIRSADGTLWYTQLAQDTVERKPYKAPDGSVAYKEKIVKKLPNPPKRKDRM